MKEFCFKFGFGTYTVSTDDVVKQSKLDDLYHASVLLDSALPYRSQQISSFIVACVDDIINSSIKLSDSNTMVRP